MYIQRSHALLNHRSREVAHSAHCDSVVFYCNRRNEVAIYARDKISDKMTDDKQKLSNSLTISCDNL